MKSAFLDPYSNKTYKKHHNINKKYFSFQKLFLLGNIRRKGWGRLKTLIPKKKAIDKLVATYNLITFIVFFFGF